MAYTINGQEHDFPSPIEQDGVTLVPLAGIVEMMGGYVYWNNDSKEAIVEMGDKKMSVQEGKTELIRPNQVDTLSAVPVMNNNHLYVPIDFFEQALGATIDVSGEDVTVTGPAT